MEIALVVLRMTSASFIYGTYVAMDLLWPIDIGKFRNVTFPHISLSLHIFGIVSPRWLINSGGLIKLTATQKNHCPQ